MMYMISLTIFAAALLLGRLACCGRELRMAELKEKIRVLKRRRLYNETKETA